MWSEQYRLDLPAVCRGFLVKMSVFRVRTCAKVYELLYNISFRDNADISNIYIHIHCCLRHVNARVSARHFRRSSLFLHIKRASIRFDLYYKKKIYMFRRWILV